MSPRKANGTLRGTTIELDAPLPALDGQRVRLVVEPANDPPAPRNGSAEFGCAAAVVRVHSDFDAPIPDFADYER
jgi:hypothetical protein